MSLIQSSKKPIMFCHYSFYDCPLNGIALYLNQKVFFQLIENSTWINLKHFDELKYIDAYYYDIDSANKIAQYYLDEGVDLSDGVSLQLHKYGLYKLYQIPQQYMKKLEEKPTLFQELDVYHADHDPLVDKEFNTINPINHNHIDHQCLGEFRDIDFDYVFSSNNY